MRDAIKRNINVIKLVIVMYAFVGVEFICYNSINKMEKEMIVIYAQVISFSSGIGMVDYYETKEQCLTSLTKYVQMNPGRIDSIECRQLEDK